MIQFSVNEAATTASRIAVDRQAVRGFSAKTGATALLIGGLWFILCRSLSIEWSGNEQYSYGWFVPFFAAYLFWLRWEDRPQRFALNVQRRTPNAERSTEAKETDPTRATRNRANVAQPAIRNSQSSIRDPKSY